MERLAEKLYTFTIVDVLLAAGVSHSVYRRWQAETIYITGANQLIGAYKELDAYRKCNPHYIKWHTHHVIEDYDLTRLGVRMHAPPYADQLCVLIPERAHIGRINSVLRRENPTSYQATAAELRSAYREAYSLVGDYCGGGKKKIVKELMAIVNAEFQKLGVC